MNIAEIITAHQESIQAKIEEQKELIAQLEEELLEMEMEKDSFQSEKISGLIEEIRDLVLILPLEGRIAMREEIFGDTELIEVIPEEEEQESEKESIESIEPPTVKENLEKIQQPEKSKQESSEPKEQKKDGLPNWTEISSLSEGKWSQEVMDMEAKIGTIWDSQGLIIAFYAKLKKNLESMIDFFVFRHGEAKMIQEIIKDSSPLKYSVAFLIPVEEIDKKSFERTLESLHHLSLGTWGLEEDEQENQDEDSLVLSFDRVTRAYNEIFEHQNRLGWSDQKLSEWLKENFNVQRIALLSDDNLIKAISSLEKLEKKELV